MGAFRYPEAHTLWILSIPPNRHQGPDLGEEQYTPLTESFLWGLGRAERWSGFYIGLRAEQERKVPIVELGVLDGITRWMCILIAPLLTTGLGLAVSIVKDLRDQRIRRRIAKVNAASGG